MSTEARSAKVDHNLQPQLSVPSPTVRKIKDSQGFQAAGGLLVRQAMLKHFVYVLRNNDVPPRYYTGLSSDVTKRLAIHNSGHCRHTAKYRPWSIDLVIEFADERRAVAFERYLKSGSGVAFAHRHLR